MGRVAQTLKSKVTLIVVLVLVVAGGGGVWWHEDAANRVQTVTNARHQITQLSYRGQNGVNAFTLLKRHAQVKYKHYSFGDFVTSIDGTAGNGPKYWTLYVNNKEASVGASAYITKNSETVTWKLQ